jgi:CubicO group peptidase (beta-lactamase class C family)
MGVFSDMPPTFSLPIGTPKFAANVLDFVVILGGILRRLPGIFLFAVLAFNATAQTTPASLSSYNGVYEYEGNTKIDMISGKDLFAVLDESKYKLPHAGGDTFLNGAGQPVTFRRDAAGDVTGFEEHGHFYRRLSPKPSAAALYLASPRPNGDLSYSYKAPADRHDGLAIGDIAQSDVGADAAAKIAEGILNETWSDVHSVLLYQRDKLVYEEYFYGYDWQHQHQLRSATKSVVATLAGIAIDRHAISGVNEPVLPHMKYTSYENPDLRKAKITLRDMLTMQSGLACNDHDNKSPGNEVVIDEKPDWVKATLDLPLINPPGTKGFYCSGGVAVAGRMVENTTHAYLPDFAQKTLFGPLGISRSQYTWNYNLTNADKEYSQIHLRPRDMMKLGILFKDGGKWHGKQVVSAGYMHDALSAISEVDDSGYGYFWWRPWLLVEMPQGPEHVYMGAAQGNGGQKIFVLPEYDFVAVFTAGSYNAGGSAPNKIMSTIILPRLLAAHGGRSLATK